MTRSMTKLVTLLTLVLLAAACGKYGSPVRSLPDSGGAAAAKAPSEPASDEEAEEKE